MKASMATWGAIIALTLITCLIFYYYSVPLEGPQITLVAGVFTALVYGAKYLGRMLNNRRLLK